MTREDEVFNAGVRAALDLAATTAESLRPQLATRRVHVGFAIEALLALAQEGRALLKGLPDAERGAEPLDAPQSGPGGALVAAG